MCKSEGSFIVCKHDPEITSPLKITMAFKYHENIRSMVNVLLCRVVLLKSGSVDRPLSLCPPALDFFLGRLFVEETGSFVLWRVCVLDFSDGVFVVLFSLPLFPLQTGVLTMEGDTVS